MNPILPVQYFVPDAEARQWKDGRMYIYGSYDLSGDTFWCSNEYRVFSSADLVNWQEHGVSFTSEDVPWHTGIIPLPLYAPDCIYKDGRYYLYFCSADNSEGVAVSDTPYGPFRDAVPVEGPHEDAIDPAVFVDDDGQAYIYWGQFNCRGARLKPDMKSIDPATLNTNLINEEEHGFHEGASLRKRNGIYYLVYTDISRGRATCIGYATSMTPLGPFKKRGIIIDNDGCDSETWNNHGSLAEFNGNWYVFYHRSSQASRYNRRVCVEPIFFNDNGSINEVEMTTQGVSAPLDAGSRVEAWRACLLSGTVCTEPVDKGPGAGEERYREHLAFIENENWAAYKYIDFGLGKTSFEALVSSAAYGGEIVIVLDSPEGTRIGSCKIGCTGGWHVWENVSCMIKPTSGVHAVFLIFKGRPNGRLFNLESFWFRD
ncbi:family 43 glycosylhydrolase [Paenibacillus terreus]|uniref:Family 43 glycosylhydrolase n=1 Tax=Paenibacillus terreus TaxID=1387834 RepID=A0ABV5BEF9_9BACL